MGVAVWVAVFLGTPIKAPSLEQWSRGASISAQEPTWGHWSSLGGARPRVGELLISSTAQFDCGQLPVASYDTVCVGAQLPKNGYMAL